MSARQTHERRQVEVVEALRDQLDETFPAAGQCGFCGDTVLGGRHRVIDAIADRIRAGEDWQDVVADWCPFGGRIPDWTADEITTAASMAVLALAVTAP